MARYLRSIYVMVLQQLRRVMNDYELFIKINDAILLEFDVFKAWEKTLLLNAQNQLMDRFPISEPQRELLTNVLEKKRPKLRKKRKV